MRKRFLCLLLATVLLLSTVAMASPEAKAQSDLHTSDKLVELLIAFEGFTGKCVVDNSQRSVGYGTRCDVCDPTMPGYLDPSRECMAYTAETPITKEHAMELKKNYLAYFERRLNAFAAKHSLTFTQHQFDALISFTYNCGEGWMLESYDPEGNFRNAIIRGDKGDKLVYAFGLWSKSGNTVSLGHIRRRMIEAQVYLSGVYAKDVTKWPEDLRYAYLDANGGETRYYYQTFHAAEICPIRAEITSVPKDEAGNDLAFVGWFTQPEGGLEVKNLSSALNNGMVLYAHWKNAAGEIVTVDADASVPADVQVVVPNWWPNTLYEGPGTYYSEVRKTALNEQLHITKTLMGKDGNRWGFCVDGWIPLSHTNYDSVINATAEGTWYQFTATEVNVRKGPGSNYETVGLQKNPGDKILVVETQENKEANQTWAKMTDGNWICIRNADTPWAVVMDPQPELSKPEPVAGVTITGISVSTLPAVLEYPLEGLDVLPDLTGAKITISYSDGGSKTQPLSRYMVSGFDNSALGTKTITVTCGGKTATFDIEIVPTTISAIAIHSKPAKTEYLFKNEKLDLTGAVLLATYEKGLTRQIPITAQMVTGFDNTTLGTNTLTVTYSGFTTTFDVTIINPVVTFLNYDGTVISQKQYAIGETVAVPENPVRPADEKGEYVFAGWDNKVVACAGNATYTATYTLKPRITFLNYDGTVISQKQYLVGEAVTIPADPVKPADKMGEYVFAGWDKPVVACAGDATYTATFKLRYAPGDLDRNDKVDESDAAYLLWHVFFPEEYPIYAWADFDKSGKVDENDGIYLMWHVFFPEENPLS